AALLAPVAGGTAPDLPGFGYSEPEKGFDFTLEAHADVVARHVEAVGAPVHLFGNSMGGAIALLVAAQRPELVKTLTLISPAVPDRRPDPRRLSDPRMALAYLPLVGAQVRAPTLVVWGRDDRVISVKRAVRTARAIPRARLLVLPRTGHVAQMERPVVVAKAVLGMWEHVEAGTW